MMRHIAVLLFCGLMAAPFLPQVASALEQPPGGLSYPTPETPADAAQPVPATVAPTVAAPATVAAPNVGVQVYSPAVSSGYRYSTGSIRRSARYGVVSGGQWSSNCDGSVTMRYSGVVESNCSGSTASSCDVSATATSCDVSSTCDGSTVKKHKERARKSVTKTYGGQRIVTSHVAPVGVVVVH